MFLKLYGFYIARKRCSLSVLTQRVASIYPNGNTILALSHRCRVDRENYVTTPGRVKAGTQRHVGSFTPGII